MVATLNASLPQILSSAAFRSWQLLAIVSRGVRGWHEGRRAEYLK